MRTAEEEASYQLFGDSAYYVLVPGAQTEGRTYRLPVVGNGHEYVTFQQLVERIKKARSK